MQKKIARSILRIIIPNFIKTLYYFLKYGAKISLRAEVDLSPRLVFGKDCVVSSFTKIKVIGGWMKFGDKADFATGCFVAASGGGLDVGDNFQVGPNVNIIGSNYNYHKKGVHLSELGISSKGIKIGNNVFIGAGATILDGTVISDNTIIVANSLLNRRYPPDSILKGNPAKIIKRREGFGRN